LHHFQKRCLADLDQMVNVLCEAPNYVKLISPHF
jgi:hypothetical protein